MLSKTTDELPSTKDIEELELAVCSFIKVILPCVKFPGVVIADIELLLCFTKPKDIMLLQIIL